MFELRGETVLFMNLDDLDLNLSMLFLSNSSFSFIYVSNLEMLLMLILSRRFAEADNLDEIYVIWSDMGCIYVSGMPSLSKRS